MKALISSKQISFVNTQERKCTTSVWTGFWKPKWAQRSHYQQSKHQHSVHADLGATLRAIHLVLSSCHSVLQQRQGPDVTRGKRVPRKQKQLIQPQVPKDRDQDCSPEELITKALLSDSMAQISHPFFPRKDRQYTEQQRQPAHIDLPPLPWLPQAVCFQMIEPFSMKYGFPAPLHTI